MIIQTRFNPGDGQTTDGWELHLFNLYGVHQGLLRKFHFRDELDAALADLHKGVPVGEVVNKQY